jgi:endonuclease/exonuclease/phosphatase family metal-dependent hydrolase
MKNTNQKGKQPMPSNCRLNLFKKVSLVLIIALSFSACKRAPLEDTKNTKEGAPLDTRGSLHPFLAANTNSFKVMSFNTRHNDSGDPHSITYRRNLIKQIVVDNDPDIVGLQEYSDQDFEDWFNDQMATLGYGKYYSQALTGTPKVIFYKTNRFILQDSGTQRISSADPSYTRTATWAILLDQVSSNRYFISNSHWQAYAEGAAERLVNATKLAAMVNANNPENLPEIVFGDFNAKPGTAEVNYIKSELQVVDALMEDENTFHGWDASGTSKIDWILSTKDMGVLKWDVIRTSYDSQWPSDHFPVMATYVPGIYSSAHSDAVGSGSANSRFYFADVDGDGDQDKILWRYNLDSGKPRVYLSNGNGTFSSSYIANTAAASGVTTTQYYLADVDGDGKADLIVWNPSYTSGKTRVYLATSGGSFSSTAIEQSASQSTLSHLYFADVNGDARADRIFWNPTNDGGNNRVYFATSGGSFSTSYVLNTNASSESTGSTYYYADINGDGMSDKILWNPSSNDGETLVYLSNGDGTFTASSSYSFAGPSTNATTRFYFADVNGDGRADKIVWRPDTYLGKTKIYLSKSTGSFDTAIYSLRSASGDEVTNFFFADINGDGKADQLFWNRDEYAGEFRNYLAR